MQLAPTMPMLPLTQAFSPPFPPHVLFRIDILKAEIEQSISPCTPHF